MTKYKERVNEETGAIEHLFNATLIKIGENVLENVNSKEYKIVTIGFELPNGEEVERTAMCYSKNYLKGIEVGKSYLCNLSFDEENNPQIRMSHISNATRASIKDFAGLFQAQEQLIEEDQVI